MKRGNHVVSVTRVTF